MLLGITDLHYDLITIGRSSEGYNVLYRIVGYSYGLVPRELKAID